jgi:vacuolar-type H+-ATPase catalytic subunit A/Vma1
MSHDDERDYEVGYGKPPLHTRFRRGQSGNPRGRPAESRNLATLVNEALNEPVLVVENGGRRKISKREAIIKQLVNRSAKADWRAIKTLLDIVREIEGRIEPEPAENSFSAVDEKVIEQIKARWHAKRGDSDA